LGCNFRSWNAGGIEEDLLAKGQQLRLPYDAAAGHLRDYAAAAVAAAAAAAAAYIIV
jgi:hypothetical protein